MLKNKIAGICFSAAMVCVVQASAFADTDLNATLNGDAEVPPVSTVAGGTGKFTINDENTELKCEVKLEDIDNTTSAAIHSGAIDSSGPVILTLKNSDFGSDFNETIDGTGFVALPAEGILSFADVMNAIRAGKTYISVNTEKHPEGEVRGQIIPKS